MSALKYSVPRSSGTRKKRRTGGCFVGSGAGFKGCCMALIDPAKAESIAETVEQKYLKAFPEMQGRYSFHLCESADGVGAGR